MSRWLRGEIVEVGGPWWRRDCRFRHGGLYEVGALGSGATIEVPDWFVFQASVPLWAAPMLATFGVLHRLRRPAALHDMVRTFPELSLWFGDLMFVDACHVERIPEPWLSICWWAVRSNNRRT